MVITILICFDKLSVPGCVRPIARPASVLGQAEKKSDANFQKNCVPACLAVYAPSPVHRDWAASPLRGNSMFRVLLFFLTLYAPSPVRHVWAASPLSGNSMALPPCCARSSSSRIDTTMPPTLAQCSACLSKKKMTQICRSQCVYYA